VAAPAANLALYIPFNIDRDTIAKQMFWENGAVAGTTDVGIYDSNKKRLVSSGPTANAGTIQIANIADTILVPGLYYMAWLPSTVATQTYWCGTTTGHTVASLRASGVQQQAVGSATLPDPAVFAVIANAYLPLVGIDFTGSM
jgi:hypothetical protein